MNDTLPPGWTALFEADLIEEGTPQRVTPDGLPPLAIFRLGDDCFVTDDTCSHGQASLADGFVEGDEIECPWHSGRFCIRTGEARTAPATEPIRVYPVRIVDGQVCIERPAPGDASSA